MDAFGIPWPDRISAYAGLKLIYPQLSLKGLSGLGALILVVLAFLLKHRICRGSLSHTMDRVVYVRLERSALTNMMVKGETVHVVADNAFNERIKRVILPLSSLNKFAHIEIDAFRNVVL